MSRVKQSAYIAPCQSGCIYRLLEGDTDPTRNRYDQYYHAFEATFPRDPSVPFYLIPGNNDIGCVSVFREKSRVKSMFTG